MSQLTRMQFRFYGRVQGVGFRYKARHLADRYRLTGWVENNYDGSVSMEAQGTQEDIERLLQALFSDRYIRIDDFTDVTVPVDGYERSFLVRGY